MNAIHLDERNRNLSSVAHYVVCIELLCCCRRREKGFLKSNNVTLANKRHVVTILQ